MKPLRLVMTNFMSTGQNVEVPLNVPGLVLISGDNQDAPKADSNGCFSGDTLIDCPRDLSAYPKGIPIRDLVGSTPYVYCWLDGSLGVRRASSVHLTKSKTPVIRVRLSKYASKKGSGLGGKYLPPQELVGTPDHRVLLSDGITWKRLDELSVGDSLCSMYRRESGGWRTLIYWTGMTSETAVSEQQFVCDKVHNKPIAIAADPLEVHHKNENSFDHSPDNLQWVTASEHRAIHARDLGDKNRTGKMGWKKTGIRPRGYLGKISTPERNRNISLGLLGMYASSPKQVKPLCCECGSLPSVSKGKCNKCYMRSYNAKVNHTVLSIEDAGLEDVYDMTVPGAANFVANGVVVHNSGKSTLFSGITYALWGKVPCPPDDTIEADDVVHDDIGKDCRVEFYFENDDGTEVCVTRTRKDSASEKPNDLILTIDKKGMSASTNEMTQEKIDALFGMDYETFCTLMPGLGKDIAKMTDSNIKELLEKILRTEELSIAYELAREKFKTLDKELAAEQAKLAAHKEEHTKVLIRLHNYKSARDDWDKNTKIEFNAAKLEKKRCAGVARAANNAVEVLVASMVKPDTDILLKKRGKLQEAQEALGTVEKKITKGQSAWTVAKAKAEAKTTALQEQIHNLQGLAECPVCLSCVEESHKDKATAQLLEKLHQVHVDLDGPSIKWHTAFEILDTKRTRINEIIEKLRTEVLSLQTDTATYAQAERDLVHLKKEAKLKLEIYKKAADELESIANEENHYSAMMAEQETRRTELQDAIDTLLMSLKALNEQLSLYEFWVKAYSPSGIRSHMMENVVPYLNDRAKYYCDRITSGEMQIVFNTKTTQKTGKIVDKFKIEVSQAHGCKRWKGSSKGERARAALVIALALGDLACMRSSKKLAFRAIDECLDPIDSEGDEAIVSLLTEMEAQFGSVYLITHKDRLKGKFQKEIVMQKKNGLTTLQGVFEREIH